MLTAAPTISETPATKSFLTHTCSFQSNLEVINHTQPGVIPLPQEKMHYIFYTYRLLKISLNTPHISLHELLVIISALKIRLAPLHQLEQNWKIIEVCQFDQYAVHVNGSGQLAECSWKFLYKFFRIYPAPPQISVTTDLKTLPQKPNELPFGTTTLPPPPFMARVVFCQGIHPSLTSNHQQITE